MKTGNWEFKITSSHRTPLSRQVTEAVRISREPTSNLLNSKNEFGCNNLPELEIKYGNKVLGQGGKKRRRPDDEEEDLSTSTEPPQPQQAEEDDTSLLPTSTQALQSQEQEEGLPTDTQEVDQQLGSIPEPKRGLHFKSEPLTMP